MSYGVEIIKKIVDLTMKSIAKFSKNLRKYDFSISTFFEKANNVEQIKRNFL